MRDGWVGFDLDGTLAVYEQWQGPENIGEPIPEIMSKLKSMLQDGQQIKIFTARVSDDPDGVARDAIINWCLKHIGIELPVTCVKDYDMVELWDDRCIAVEHNTGRILGGNSRV